MYKGLLRERRIRWLHVYSHERERRPDRLIHVSGNEMADKLADKGAKGETSAQSRRWAAPDPEAPHEQELDKCRRCGKIFLIPRACGVHESKCKVGSVEDLVDLACRKCGLVIPEPNSRTKRLAHERICRGSPEANLKCDKCGVILQTIDRRVRHEKSCAQNAENEPGN